jgi:Fe-S-cluster containining protein
LPHPDDQPPGWPEMDFSELRGKTYTCIDGCALCCLCQPELLPDEEERFRKDPRLSEAIATEHISPDVEGAAIKLKGSHGACHFLTNRRCGIYNDRPHYCRAFPVNVFVGWRVQFYANRSCRGIGLPGEDLLATGRGMADGFGRDVLLAETREAGRVFDEFVANTREARVAQSFASVRGAASALAEEMIDRLGLSRVLTYAEHGNTRQNSPVQDIVKLVRRTEAEADLEERALIDGTELFDLPELSHLPIYIDDGLRWRIFQLKGNEIVGHLLDEDGGIEECSRTDPSGTELLPLKAEGAWALSEYLAVVNSRDCFLGHAAHLCDMEGYEFNLAQVYLGALANNTLDLWWRASFLAGMDGKKELGAKEIREGIVFYDMDLLDLPTIGAFI